MEFYCFGIPEPLDTADSAAARDFFDYNENPREDWYFAKVRKVHKAKSPFRCFDFSSRSSLNANLNDAVALFLLLLFLWTFVCLRKLSILLCCKVCIELQLHFFPFFSSSLNSAHCKYVHFRKERSWWVKDVTVFMNFNLDSCRRCSAIWRNVSRDREKLSLKASDISQLRLKLCTRVQLARAEHLYARFIKREIQLYWRCLNRYVRSIGEAKRLDETRVKSWIKIPISPNSRSWGLRVNCIWFCVSFYDWIWHEYPISKRQARSSVMTAQQESDFPPT